MKEKKDSKALSIVTIICFATILFIPIGLVLMWFSTSWNKKTKVFISLGVTVLYAAIIAVILLLQPSYNTRGVSLPVNVEMGYSDFNTEMPSSKKAENKREREYKTNQSNKGGESDSDIEPQRLPKTLKKGAGKSISRWIYILMFFLFMLLLIINQNIKASKNKAGYDNPYVDTSKYKLPLEDDAKMPMVHFLKVKLNQNEKILYATETTQKNNEGNFVVTNQRVVMLSKEENSEFPLQYLTAVASVSNSAMMMTSGDRKYYVFLHDTELKYALAVVRWAYAHLEPATLS